MRSSVRMPGCSGESAQAPSEDHLQLSLASGTRLESLGCCSSRSTSRLDPSRYSACCWGSKGGAAVSLLKQTQTFYCFSKRCDSVRFLDSRCKRGRAGNRGCTHAARGLYQKSSTAATLNDTLAPERGPFACLTSAYIILLYYIILAKHIKAEAALKL